MHIKNYCLIDNVLVSFLIVLTYQYQSMNAAQLKQSNYYCDICKVTCGGEINYKGHLKSEKHRQSSKNFECYYCKTRSINEKSYNDHIQTAVHHRVEIKFFESIKTELNLANEGKPVGRVFLEKTIGNAGQDEYYCNLCHCSLDRNSVDPHLSGGIHWSGLTEEAKRVLGAGETSSNSKDETSKVEQNLFEQNQSPMHQATAELLFKPTPSASFTKQERIIVNSEFCSNSSLTAQFAEMWSEQQEDLSKDEAHLQYYVNQGKTIQPVGEIYLDRLPINDGHAEYYCKLCDSFIFGEGEKDNHLKSPVHCVKFDKKFNEKLRVDLGIKQLGEPVGENYLVVTKSSGPVAILYYCTLCDCPVYSGPKDSHLRGRKHHFSFEQKIGPIWLRTLRGPKYNLEQRNQKVEDDSRDKDNVSKDTLAASFEPTQKKANVGFDSKSENHKQGCFSNDLQSYYCHFCCVQSKNENAFNEHLKLAAHQKAELTFFERMKKELILKKAGEPVGEAYVERVEKSSLNAHEYYCSLCDSSFDGDDTIKSHCGGRQHRSWLTHEVDRVLGNQTSLTETAKVPTVEQSCSSEQYQSPMDPTAAVKPFEPVLTTGQMKHQEQVSLQVSTFGGGLSCSNPITTLVTVLSTGQPAKDLKVTVFRQNFDGTSGIDIEMKRTREDGTTPSLLSDYTWTPGVYRVIFDTEEYFRNRSAADVMFLPTVDITVSNVTEYWNIQVKISPDECSIKVKKILQNAK